jgi:hypothetical protein
VGYECAAAPQLSLQSMIVDDGSELDVAQSE